MIKKIITGAALIAAGTALASADTLSSTTVSADDTTLGDLGLTGTYDYASYNWCISFTVDTTNKTGGSALFVLDSTVATGATNAGLEVYVNTNKGYLNITNSNGVHLSSPNSAATGGDTSDAVFDISLDSLDISLSWSASDQVMTLSTTTTTDGTTYSTTLNLSEDATYIQYATLSANSAFPTASSMPISNLELTITEVPEPSMFGLLAGLGAIGLVATRRRRNRKA